MLKEKNLEKTLDSHRSSKGDLIIKTQSSKTQKLLDLKRKQDDLDYIEKMWAIQDKWQLISWGMRQKNAILFRKQFLSSTEHLKDRFKILLGKFLRKRAEK